MGTVVGLPHFWQFNVMPAAAESTTNDAEQFEQAKIMSPLDPWAESVEPLVGCIELFTKQVTYRPGRRNFVKSRCKIDVIDEQN